MFPRASRALRAGALLACVGVVECASPLPPPPARSPTLAAPQSSTACDHAGRERVRAKDLLAHGWLDRGLRTLARADAACPESAAESWEVALPVLAELGRAAEVRALARTVEAAAGASPSARQAARAALQAIESTHPDEEALLEAAGAASARGEADVARRLYDRAIEGLSREPGASASLDLPPSEAPSVLRYTPDGRRLVVVAHDTLQIVDVASRRVTLRPVLGPVRHWGPVTITPDGGIVAFPACPSACALALVDTRDGRVLGRTPIETDMWHGFEASVDGRLLLGASWDRLTAWDARNGALRWKAEAEGGLKGFTQSPNGRVVAVAYANNLLRTFDAATGALVRVLQGTPEVGPTMFDEEGLPFTMAFSPDGSTLASLRYGSGVHLWNVATGKRLRAFPRPEGSFATIAGYEPSGRAIRLWMDSVGATLDLGSGKIDKREGDASAPSGTYLEGAGCRVVGHHDERGVLDLEDSATRRPVSRIDLGSGSLYVLTCSPDGRELVTPSGNGTLRFWDIASGRLAATMEAGPIAIQVASVAFAPDGASIAVGSEHAVEIRDTASGAALASFDVEGRGLAFSPDGELLAAQGRKSVQILDVRARKKIGSAPCMDCGAIAWSADGAELAVSGGLGLARWSRSKRDVVDKERRFRPAYGVLAYLPNGSGVVLLDAKSAHVLRFASDAVEDLADPPGDLVPGLVTAHWRGGLTGGPCRDPAAAATAREPLEKLLARTGLTPTLAMGADCRRVALVHEGAVVIADLLGTGPEVRITFLGGGETLVQEVSESETGDLVPRGPVEALGPRTNAALRCFVGPRALPAEACIARLLDPGLFARALRHADDR